MGADDLRSAFGARSEDQKALEFEKSTLALILRQLGATAPYVRKMQSDLGPSFNCEWFNSHGWIPRVEVIRCFRYNFEEIYKKPSKSFIVKRWIELMQEGETSELNMVFKVHSLGRMVATDLDLYDRTHVHVALRDHRINITPFSSFFTDEFGELPSLEEMSCQVN